MADVTCVIPTHDRDRLLVGALASVLAQDDLPAAVVVSDDRGSAATRAAVERASAGAAVGVTYLDSSGGPGTAGASRNAGALGATTQYLAFLDDDDLWEPSFLSRAVRMLESEHVDLVVAWVDEIGTARACGRMRAGLSARDVVGRNPGFFGSNVVVRTDAFRQIGGFDGDLPVSNDKDLLVRALLDGKRYAVLEEPLVRYRVHGAGQLSDRTPRRRTGIQTYMVKHAGLLSHRDSVFLRAQITSISRVIEPTRARRLLSACAFVAYRLTYAAMGGRG